jgi:hypothetical protein
MELHNLPKLGDFRCSLSYHYNDLTISLSCRHGTLATIWPIVPALDDECGAIGGMRISRGN